MSNLTGVPARSPRLDGITSQSSPSLSSFAVPVPPTGSTSALTGLFPASALATASAISSLRSSSPVSAVSTNVAQDMFKKLQNMPSRARNMPGSFAQPSPAIASLMPKMSPTFQGLTPLMHSNTTGSNSMLNDSFELTRSAASSLQTPTGAAPPTNVSAATAAMIGSTPALLGMSPAASAPSFPDFSLMGKSPAMLRQSPPFNNKFFAPSPFGPSGTSTGPTGNSIGGMNSQNATHGGARDKAFPNIDEAPFDLSGRRDGAMIGSSSIALEPFSTADAQKRQYHRVLESSPGMRPVTPLSTSFAPSVPSALNSRPGAAGQVYLGAASPALGSATSALMPSPSPPFGAGLNSIAMSPPISGARDFMLGLAAGGRMPAGATAAAGALLSQPHMSMHMDGDDSDTSGDDDDDDDIGHGMHPHGAFRGGRGGRGSASDYMLGAKTNAFGHSFGHDEADSDGDDSADRSAKRAGLRRKVPARHFESLPDEPSLEGRSLSANRLSFNPQSNVGRARKRSKKAEEGDDVDDDVIAKPKRQPHAVAGVGVEGGPSAETIATLLPTSGNGSGSSCHQCKSRRGMINLIYCSNMLVKKSDDRRQACRKKYCEQCLMKFYGEHPPDRTDDPTAEWPCPACRGLCQCAACRKRANGGGAADDDDDIPAPKAKTFAVSASSSRGGRGGSAATFAAAYKPAPKAGRGGTQARRPRQSIDSVSGMDHELKMQPGSPLDIMAAVATASPGDSRSELFAPRVGAMHSPMQSISLSESDAAPLMLSGSVPSPLVNASKPSPPAPPTAAQNFFLLQQLQMLASQANSSPTNAEAFQQQRDLMSLQAMLIQQQLQQQQPK